MALGWRSGGRKLADKARGEQRNAYKSSFIKQSAHVGRGGKGRTIKALTTDQSKAKQALTIYYSKPGYVFFFDVNIVVVFFFLPLLASSSM